MNPMKVLAMVKALGGEPKRILLIGCEPTSSDERMGLSEPVEAAVDEAVGIVESLIAKITGDQTATVAG
jgi:hydrogenase maturation protease